MPYKLRQFQCSGCGDVVERHAAAGAEVRCINCAIQRSVDNMVQLRRKVGPFYKKWMKGIAAAIAREQEWADMAAQLEDMNLGDDR